MPSTPLQQSRGMASWDDYTERERTLTKCLIFAVIVAVSLAIAVAVVTVMFNNEITELKSTTDASTTSTTTKKPNETTTSTTTTKKPDTTTTKKPDTTTTKKPDTTTTKKPDTTTTKKPDTTTTLTTTSTTKPDTTTTTTTTTAAPTTTSKSNGTKTAWEALPEELGWNKSLRARGKALENRRSRHRGAGKLHGQFRKDLKAGRGQSFEWLTRVREEVERRRRPGIFV